MWALLIVEINPVTNDPAGVLKGLEAMAIDALFFQSPDQSFNESILLRCVTLEQVFTGSIHRYPRLTARQVANLEVLQWGGATTVTGKEEKELLPLQSPLQGGNEHSTPGVFPPCRR